VRRVASLVVLALAVLSCSNTAVQHAERLVSNGDLEGARAALEAEHQREPEDVDVRMARVIRDVVKRSVLRPVRAKMSEEFG
jgi:hypothetical protein